MWLLGGTFLLLGFRRAYADVVLCKLVMEVVYADLTSVTMDGSAMFWLVEFSVHDLTRRVRA